MDALRARWDKQMKGVPKSEWNSPKNSALWQKMYQEMQASAAYKKQRADYDRLDKELQKYVQSSPDRTRGPDRAHGYVWLFRRK
jgi:hypothetical protein